MINFLHKSLHEQHLDESIGFDPVLLRNECMSEIQTKWSVSWSIFFTNPYPSKIHTNRSVFIKLCAEIATSRQSDLWDDQFSSQIPTRARSRWIVYSVWQILTIASEFLMNCFLIAYPNKVDWRKKWGQIWTAIWKRQKPFPRRIINIVRDDLSQLYLTMSLRSLLQG